MKINKMAMTTAILGFLITVGLTSAFAKATADVTKTGWVPFGPETFYNACSGEDLTTSGMRMLKTVTVQDAGGGSHTSYQLFIRGTAVGDVSGAGYVFSEVSNSLWHQNATGADTDTFHFISLDKNLPDYIVRFSFRLVLDANGNQRVEMSFDGEHCK